MAALRGEGRLRRGVRRMVLFDFRVERFAALAIGVFLHHAADAAENRHRDVRDRLPIETAPAELSEQGFHHSSLYGCGGMIPALPPGF
jgi:hypothetical protein